MIGYIVIGVLVLIFYKPVMNFILYSKKKEFDRLTNDPKYQSILKKYNIEPVPYDQNTSFKELRKLQGLDDETLKQKKILEKQKKEARKRKSEQRLKQLIEKYGSEKGELIHKGKVDLGMTTEMVIDSKGKPKEVIEKVSRGKKREEYFYGRYKNRLGKYSYKFRVVLIDGKVDGWNDIKK